MPRQMPAGKVRLMMDVPAEVRDAFKVAAAKAGVAPNELFSAWVKEHCKKEVAEARRKTAGPG